MAGLQRAATSTTTTERTFTIGVLLPLPQCVLIWSGRGCRAPVGFSSSPIAADWASVSFTVRPTTSSSLPRHRPTTTTSGRCNDPIQQCAWRGRRAT